MYFARQINQFIEIARSGSFVRAAEKISLTPSALSHGICELENRVGKKLIVRSKTGVKLTRAGKQFYDEIASIYDKGNSAFERFCAGDNSGDNLIICIDGFFYPNLQSKLSRLMKKSNSHINILNDSPSCIIDGIREEKYDIAISVNTGINSIVSSGICRVALPTEDIGLVVTKNMLSRYPDVLSLLRSESIIQCNPTLNHPVYQGFKEKMRRIGTGKSFIGLPDIVNVCSAVINELGVCLASNNVSEYITSINHELTFISKPFPFDTKINRDLYFKESRHEELIDSVMCICEK